MLKSSDNPEDAASFLSIMRHLNQSRLHSFKPTKKLNLQNVLNDLTSKYECVYKTQEFVATSRY